MFHTSQEAAQEANASLLLSIGAMASPISNIYAPLKAAHGLKDFPPEVGNWTIFVLLIHPPQNSCMGCKSAFSSNSELKRHFARKKARAKGCAAACPPQNDCCKNTDKQQSEGGGGKIGSFQVETRAPTRQDMAAFFCAANTSLL